MDFSFDALYQFIITVLGMILSYRAGRHSSDNKTTKK